MLVLTRKAAETIHIGDNIVIKLIKTGRGTVKIGIEAPEDVRVMRGELVAEPKTEAAATAPAAPRLNYQFGGVVSDQYPHVA